MLVLASASPRRRELLAQAGFSFEVHPVELPEDPLPNEDPIAYVVRLAREKAQAAFRELTETGVAAPGVAAPGTDRGVSRSKTDRGVSRSKGASLSPRSQNRDLGHPGMEFRDRSPVAEGSRPDGKPCPDGQSCLSGQCCLSGQSSLAVLGADTTVTLDRQILGKPVGASDAARMLRLLAGRTHRVLTGVALVTADGVQVAAEATAVRFLTISDEEIAAYIATGEPMDKAGAYAIQGRAARWTARIEGCYFNVVGLPIALVTSLLESLPGPPSPEQKNCAQ